MKKFHVNTLGNFNIYGEIIPINAFYGKIGDTLYYCCITTKKEVEEIKEKLPLVGGVLPLPIYTWQGEISGFMLSWDYGIIAKTIYEQAEKRNAWNSGVKKDICYGISNMSIFMKRVDRKHKTKSIKAGSKYHAKYRYTNKGEIRLEHGEQVLQYKPYAPEKKIGSRNPITF